MLEFFRNVIRSKVGAGIALLVLVLIAFAFASGDVANTGGFGGVAGGDRAATVGDDRIDTAQLSQAATSALERMKQDDPRMSMKAFLASGGLDNVLADLIDRTAISEFGKRHGMVASNRLVDSEIAQISAFKGPDGNFSQEVFRQAVQQQGLSEAQVREDLAQGLVARQVLVPAAFGSVAPMELARRYAALLRDRRTGAMAVLPSAAFAPASPPTDAEIAAFYKSHSNNFIRPERRVIRYASFGEEALKSVPAPSEAEIAARYKQDQAKYAAVESRSVTQLIVPTEAAAKAIIAEASAGKPLEAAARAKGLATAKLDALTRATLARQSSEAVANAVFATARGAIATPAKSALGWHVMRVDAVDTRAARTLDQARGEIVQALGAEKRRDALTEQLTQLENRFDGGANLAEAAKELGLALQQTAPVTADGQLYNQPGQKVPPVLERVIATAFSMEGENQPQLAEVEPGKTFVIFDVADIEPSAPAPLDQIKDDVRNVYINDKGYTAARAAATRVQAAVRKGATLQAAIASLGKPLPAVQNVTMTREQLAQMQQGGNVPPALAMLFSMAEGTVKLLPAPMDRGWFVVSLAEIEPGALASDDPLIAATRRELGSSAGGEYVEAMRRAIRAEVVVKRNEASIKAVRDQLAGGN